MGKTAAPRRMTSGRKASGRKAERNPAAAGKVEPLALEAFLPYRLSVVSNRVSSAIAADYAERFDLTIAEWRIMAVLGIFPGILATEVARRTAMDKVQVSRAVARLSKSQRIEREPDSSDRRASRLHLSAAGRRVYEQIVPLARAYETALLEALSDRERAQLERLMAKLMQRAEAFGEGSLQPV